MFIRLKSARKTATKSLKTVRICPILVDLEHMTKDELTTLSRFINDTKRSTNQNTTRTQCTVSLFVHSDICPP